MSQKLQNICILSLLLCAILSATIIGHDETGVMGPIDRIVLEGNNNPIDISNREGRISFGESNTSTVWSIAFMEVGKALSQMMEASHYVDAREELRIKIENQLLDARKILDGIMEEARQISNDSEQSLIIRQRWDQAMKDFQKLQQIAAEQQGRLFSSQMIEAYQEIVGAVEVVAERNKVDIVLRTISTTEPIETTNPDAAIMQIRLRSALTYPESIDLTDEILIELGLDAE